MPDKEPFDIDEAFRRLRLALAGRPKAAMFDLHVHRVANRWGYVEAATPEKTLAQLADKLPERYWVEIDERLVPFGKFICTGVKPHCSDCILLSMCKQVGVTEHR